MTRHRTLLLAMLVVISVIAPAATAPVAVAESSDSTCEFPITKTDATGTTVTITETPNRIVTLQPSAAQTVWEVGGRDRVVGITEYATYLEDTEDIEIVGQFQIDIETVIGLNPDLVLAPNSTSTDTIAKLRQAGLTVYHFREAKSLDVIVDKTELTGELIGNCEQGQARAQQLANDIEIVREAVAGESKPKVAHFLTPEYAAGRDTFISRIIETAGGTNAFADRFSSYQPVSQEVVLNEDPVWITKARDFELPSTYDSTTAVRKDQTLVLNESYISQPAPRIIIPMVNLVEQLHPEAYRDEQLSRLEDDDSSPRANTFYSETMTDDGAARLTVTNYRYYSQPPADFTVPPTFTENRTITPRNVTIELTEPNRVYGTEIQSINASSRSNESVRFITAYRFNRIGIWNDGIERVNITLAVNTSKLNVSADELRVYWYESSNWSRTGHQLEATNNSTTIAIQHTGLSQVAIGVARTPPSADSQRTETSNMTSTSTPIPVSPTPISTETPTRSEPSPTASATTTTPVVATTRSNGPGFGVLVPVVILATLGVLLRRRIR